MVSHHDGNRRGMSGATLITLAAIGGGLYYFYGPNGREHRRQAKQQLDRGAKVAGKALTEVKGWNKEAGAAVLSALQTRYPIFKDIDWTALSELGDDAKKYWQNISGSEKGNSRSNSRRKSRRSSASSA